MTEGTPKELDAITGKVLGYRPKPGRHLGGRGERGRGIDLGFARPALRSGQRRKTALIVAQSMPIPKRRRQFNI